MRVLHLIDLDSPDGGPCTLRLLADVMRRMNSVRHEAVLIGGKRAAELTQRCGISGPGWISSPRSLPWATMPALRQLVRNFQQANAGFDLVHAWTMQTAAQSSLAFGDDLPNIATFHAGPGSGLRTRGMLQVIKRSGSQKLLVASPSVRREFRDAGVPLDRLIMLPTAVYPEAAVMADRAAVRTRFSEILESTVDENTFIIGLMGEPANGCDARTAATIAARIILSGRRAKVLVHPDAAFRLQAVRLLRNLGLEGAVILDEAVAEPWRVLNGLDAAMFLQLNSTASDAASVLPMLWAMASGVPVIAQLSGPARDIIEHGVNGILIDPADENGAADRIARLHDDQSLGRSLSLEGRNLVKDMFDIDAYCERLKHAYDLLLADRAVRIMEDLSGSSAFRSEEPVAA